MRNFINNKNYQLIFIIATLLFLLLLIVFFVIQKDKSESIEEVAELWHIYDLNINEIKNNLDEIIEPSETAVCGNLKGLELTPNSYSMALNEVACSIITYYYDLIEFDESYHNYLLKYRDWSKITFNEVKDLRYKLMRDGSYLHNQFRLMQNHYKIDDNELINNLLTEINNFSTKFDLKFYEQEELNYKEIFTHKIAEISHVSYLSNWLKEEYYSYMK